MNARKLTAIYIAADALSAMIAWSALFAFRKWLFEPQGIQDINQVFCDTNFWWGILIIPIGWLSLYWMQGAYKKVFRKARLKELKQTLFASAIGVIIIFFALLLDDNIQTYSNYYASSIFLFAVHFITTYSIRLCITSNTVRKVHSRQIGFPTLIIGSSQKAYQTYLGIDNQEIYSGNLFKGFISTSETDDPRLLATIPRLGNLDDLKQQIEKHQIEEVIIAIEDNDLEKIRTILRTLNECENLIIKITPDSRDHIFGTVKAENMFQLPLITISRQMEDWQRVLKRGFDIIISLIAIIILSPAYIFTAIMVKCTSPGPIFYTQERVGYRGKPFKMHKFRSMYVNAEQAGPALSKDDDPRITPFGKFMRKVRLDEIPQFYNVLKGTMSIVGPRPERQYYINQIVERAPEYLLLQHIKPGITSWGQVKYGYASSVDEMVERLRYDLLYLDNMTITTDIKIMLYTVIIIFQGRGK